MLPILFNKPCKTDGWPDKNTTELIRLETLTFNTVWYGVLCFIVTAKLTNAVQEGKNLSTGCPKTCIYLQFLCIYHNFVTTEEK